jgi:hypothetical protein
MTIYDDLIKRSDWNFDWDRDMPNKYVKNLGNFDGDWEVDEITGEVCPCGPKSYQQLEEMGGSLDKAWDYNLVDADNHPVLYELAKSFGLNDLFVELHVQRPGQMHNLHMDMGALGGAKDVDRTKQVARLFVMLSDWRPGQVIMFGSDHWWKWKKGDAVYFDWYNVPHGTCNFGHHHRPLLSVTGTKTPEFNEKYLGIKN